MSKLTDLSNRSGVYMGDLKYGRTMSGIPMKGKDFTGDENQPVAPLVLVQARDRRVWTKDQRVKEAKKEVGNSQHLINYLIDSYSPNCGMKLVVGRQRL